MRGGRGTEAERIAARLDAGAPIAVCGEAGIGKTTLVHRAAAATGRRVLAGGGVPSLAHLPYLPIAQAIRRLPSGRDGSAAAIDAASRVGDGVLLLDDLQWADPETLAVLPLLARRVRLATIFRAPDARAAALRRLSAEAGFDVIELEGLDRESAAELVSARNPALGAADVARIVKDAGGNPLLLEELARPGAAPGGLDEIVGRRLEALSQPAREALAVLDLLGRAAPVQMLGGQAETLREQGLVNDEGGLVVPRHRVMARRALDGLDPAVRRGLHARLARLVADQGEAARHHALAGERDLALEGALRAAAASPRPAERAGLLSVAAACAEGTEADRLRLAAAEAAAAAGDLGAAERIARTVGSGDSALAARAAAHVARARVAAGDAAGALAAVDAALRLPSLAAAEILALRIEAVRAGALSPGDDRLVAEAAARWREAWAAAGEGDDDGGDDGGGAGGGAEGGAGGGAEGGDGGGNGGGDRGGASAHLVARAGLALGEAQLAAGGAGWAESLGVAMETARRHGLAELECAAAHTVTVAHTLLGDPDRARALATRMLDRTRELHLAGWRVRFLACRLWLDLHQMGACAEVTVACRELLAVEPAGPVADQLRTLLALALADVGDLSAAATVLRTSPPAAGTSGAALHTWTAAEVAWLSGDVATAVALARLCVTGQRHPVPALAAVTLAWAARESGAAGGETRPATAYGGATDECAGVRDLAASPGSALDSFSAAADRWKSAQVRGVLRCAWAAAEAARLRGDVEDGRRRLERLLEASAALGERAPIRLRAARSLRQAGGRTVTAPSTGAGGLTAKEREVMELVAEGLTTGLIAARLQVAPSTVVTHVKSAVAKLGARTRVEAASRLVER